MTSVKRLLLSMNRNEECVRNVSISTQIKLRQTCKGDMEECCRKYVEELYGKLARMCRDHQEGQRHK